MAIQIEQNIKQLLTDGDFPQAFKLLVKEYKEPIYWHVLKILVDEEDAKDATQTAFINAWRSIDKFRQESKIKTWLYRIATNEALQLIRKRKNNLSLSNEMNLYAFEDIEGDEIERKLNAAIQTLPEKQKLVFTMKYFEELKYKEISEILGTSEGGLKASYHLAVKKIELFLNED